MHPATPQDIHAATVIRLQVAHNALNDAIPAVRDAVSDLPAIVKRLTALGEAGAAQHVSETLEKLDEVLPLLHAALDIARGARTDVPRALRGSLAPDPAMLTRFLEIPAQGA
jgi:hypothetical protein